MSLPMPTVMKCQQCARLFTSTWMDTLCYQCKQKQKKLTKVVNKFVNSQQKLAKKYNCQISIGTPGNMVVIADERKDKNKG